MSAISTTAKQNRHKNGKTRPKPRSSRDNDHASTSSPPPLNWHDDRPVPDITVPWMYEAHSIILLAIVLIVILYCAFTMPGSTQLGMRLNIFFFMAVGCLVFPAGPFVRPHPILWRFVFTLSVLYCCFLVFLVAQTPADARATLSRVFNDPSLGVPQEERSYALDCRLVPEVILSCCDRFIIAHFLGWVAKAAIVRDRLMLWIMSCAWELIELATRYFVPNFAECWWDQLFLDVLICNALGIEAGLFLAKHYKTSERDWLGAYNFPGLCLRFKRLALQFTPLSITPMYWEPMSTLKSYFHAIVAIAYILVMDFNAFSLKLWLYVPIEHDLNVWRLVLSLFIALPAAKQYYLFMTDARCKKMGSQVWVAIMVMVLELALSFKCAPSPFPEMPKEVKTGLSVAGVVFLVVTYVMFRDLKHVKTA